MTKYKIGRIYTARHQILCIRNTGHMQRITVLLHAQNLAMRDMVNRELICDLFDKSYITLFKKKIYLSGN
jgi:hypothetical protein